MSPFGANAVLIPVAGFDGCRDLFFGWVGNHTAFRPFLKQAAIVALADVALPSDDTLSWGKLAAEEETCTDFAFSLGLKR